MYICTTSEPARWPVLVTSTSRRVEPWLAIRFFASRMFSSLNVV